jgi:hypothetical protein
MSAAWVPLRQHLREYLEPQIDAIILHDPDPMARAWFAAHKERALDMMLDKVELAYLRQALASLEEQRNVVPIAKRRVNGAH